MNLLTIENLFWVIVLGWIVLYTFRILNWFSIVFLGFCLQRFRNIDREIWEKAGITEVMKKFEEHERKVKEKCLK